MDIQARAVGAFLGLACGDAVGARVEFLPRTRFKPLTDMQGGGKFRLAKGKWTDDTSMAICLAESLIAKNGFDPYDQLQRYYQWASTGINSSLDRAFGMGKQVAMALGEFRKKPRPYSLNTASRYSGNGSLMRLIPVLLFYHRAPELMVKYAGLSSKTTHASQEAVQSCEYFALLISRIFAGRKKQNLFEDNDALRFEPLTHICQGLFKTKCADQVGSAGYVIDSLEAALWAFWHTDNFRAAILAAANLGDDADTNAAICGQIAGAYYGVENIPSPWLEVLYRKADIEQLALGLIQNRL
ncbi:ADP-ribosyl-[dinitrogen reductase] hydrolase [Mesocricetibacter intestinalis]|uniref:ADP-ribosyl-[dinitrogen reductase] hydrolase n=1 Tax=Mesocricetibacter intestinalis TaxID=1521930 RepID=A0A4R6VEW4_9PAST|nr:ADP-ribosylglycohydrolase family protein [Mesocricetibacter intestinalis]TDQ59068.1 ADP-ribosyl-[dinitrogen reductase] hydrolase [Mesocricetibacter intestinalis]